MNRRGFIKLSGTTLFIAGFMGIEKLPIFKPEYEPVCITLQDCDDALEFWRHFNGNKPAKISGIPPKLEVIFNEMKATGITPKNQFEFKMAIVKEIATCKKLFNDELFGPIVKECKNMLKSKFIS